MMLQNIALAPVEIYGQAVQRRIALPSVVLTVDYGQRRMALYVPILHYVATHDELLPELAYEQGVWSNTSGRLWRKMPVDDVRVVDQMGNYPATSTLGGAAVWTPEFTFLQNLLNAGHQTLEALIAYYVHANAQRGAFDDDRYPLCMPPALP